MQGAGIMVAMTAVPQAPARSPFDWAGRLVWPVVATIAVVIAISAMWHLAIPRDGFCFAIHPAPAGCAGTRRIAPAILGTVVLALVWIASLASGFTRRIPLRARLVAVALTIPLAFFAHRFVLFA